MKPETANRLMDAYLEVFEKMSIPTFHKGIAEMATLMERHAQILRRSRSRNGLMAQLLKETTASNHVFLDTHVVGVLGLNFG